MLKAVAYGERDGEERTLIVFGLSAENVRRMVGGDPILVKFSDLKLGNFDPDPCELVIFEAPTEKDALRVMNEVYNIAGNAEIHEVDTPEHMSES